MQMIIYCPLKQDKVHKIGIRSGIDFHVFRKGIRPVWEDDVNKAGVIFVDQEIMLQPRCFFEIRQ